MTAAIAGADRAARPGLAWALPALGFFVFFALLPMVLVGYLSLTDWDGIGDPQYIGMANWTRLFNDPGMLEATRLSVLLTAASWLVQTPIAILLGVWAAGPQRNRAVLSAVFFLPLVLSMAAITLTWKALLEPNFGLISVVGPWVGLTDGNLLGTDHGAFAAILLVVTWTFVPFHTLLYQAAARGVPRDLHEAAMIDGASRRREFFAVTLPLLRNTVVTSSVLMIVGSLTFFEVVLLLTRGGPGTATRILPLFMYDEGFTRYHMGYGSAIALVLVLAGTIMSILLVRITGYHRMRSSLDGD